MNGPTKTALYVAGAAAAVLLFGGAITGAVSTTNPGGAEGGQTGVWLSDDLQPGLAQPSTIPNALSRRHPLYRRPSEPRPFHRALCTNGWGAWITKPPSEEG